MASTNPGAVQVEFEAADTAIDLSAERAIGVYRIFQEAITNVARHSQAQAVMVRLLVRDGTTLRLEVADDGLGMDVECQFSPSPEHHVLGLLTMRERAKELGGCLSLTSTPGAGTRLVLEVPLHAETVAP